MRRRASCLSSEQSNQGTGSYPYCGNIAAGTPSAPREVRRSHSRDTQACCPGGGGCKLAQLQGIPTPCLGGRAMRFLGTLVALLVLLAAAPAGTQPKPAIEKGSAVKMEYTLKDDKGQVLDSSEGKDPISFVQGAQQIIPGL